MTFRALSIDGGGMRGIYTATYLAALERAFAARRGVAEGLDIGRVFDLIVGTSTGAILGCGLAKGISPTAMADLYRAHGPQIFRRKMPSRFGWDLLRQFATKRRDLRLGDEALRGALLDIFGNATIRDLWDERRIALAIPAVNIATYRSWVFKTPHLPKGNLRDDDCTLVDVCLASSAAPMFRSMALIRSPSVHRGDVFVDGGLWANNPVLVTLLEALRMCEDRDDEIEIFSLGTCGKPEGEIVAAGAVHRTLLGWKFGGEAAKIAIAAQEYAFDNMAQLLAQHLDRGVRVVRFPADKLPGALLQYLDLDETRPEGLDALVSQARRDADMTNSLIQGGVAAGTAIEALFSAMPERT